MRAARVVPILLSLACCQCGTLLGQEAEAVKKMPNIDFRVKMLDDPVPLPTQQFSVRQMNSVWHEGKGECHFMNTAGVTDSRGHFTQWIYPVRCTCGSATGKRRAPRFKDLSMGMGGQLP